MTSSRQSPKISPDKHGLPFVPLLETTPSAFNNKSVLSAFQFHLLMET